MRIVLALAAACLAPSRPHFADLDFVLGEPDVLQVKVIAAPPLFDGATSALVEVAVKNSGDTHAEPLAFQFAPRNAKDGFEAVEVWRVAFPHHGRAGRGVAPGEARDYALVVPLPAEQAKACDVTVLRASFTAAARELEAPVELGRVRRESEFRSEYQRTIPVTHVELTNRLDVPVDAVFRATYTEPTEATTLLEFRLAPKESRIFTVEELRTGNDASWTGAEVKKLELVDWCALLSDGAARAAELFTAAYGRWITLPDDAPPLRARFAFEQEIGPERLRLEGLLRIDGASAVELLPFGRFDLKARDAARSAVMDVLQLVRRPTAAEVLASSAVQLLAWGETSVVRFDTASFLDGQRDLYLALRGGRIVRSNLTPDGRIPRIWHSRDEGDGYVVTGREQMATFQERPQESERFEYVRLGELVLPTSYRRRFTLERMPDADQRVQLVLTDWLIDPDERPLEALAPPSGPTAERLRAAWDATYRYPEDTVELNGRFSLENPGTDDLWLGHRKVEGTFTLHDFRGTLWSGFTIDIDGKKLGEREKAQLAEVIDDRFRMFAGRDFGGRGGFDEVFAGAELGEHGDVLLAKGASVVELELTEGRPARLLYSGGLERRFEWTRVRGAFVPKRITTGKEEITATWALIQDGWFYPKKIELRDVFEDWGPETLTLSKVRVGGE